MNKCILRMAMSLILCTSTAVVNAEKLTYEDEDEDEYAWAIATFDGEKEPEVIEYFGENEKGTNGLEYLRIFRRNSDGKRYRYNEKLSYGLRWSDKNIYIYDFNRNEERLAFDFSLSAGNCFTTYNGVEWIVESVKDTLVNISFMGEGALSKKKLLNVCSLDGCFRDKWLEEYGSLSNHMMIFPLNEKRKYKMLWIAHKVGHNLIKTLASDPFYTLDTGYSEDYDLYSGKEIFTCSYENGRLNVDFECRTSNRLYYLLYRKNDDFHVVYSHELSPATDCDEGGVKGSFVLTGVPAPQCGKYTMHMTSAGGSQNDATEIRDWKNGMSGMPEKVSVYDAQGRKQAISNKGGINIIGGQKVYMKQ